MSKLAGTPVTATTVASPEAFEHGEMSFLGINPGGFVALSMIVVILILVWKKVPAVIGKALDKQIVEIRTRLDEAATLRAEAEALRAEYLAKTAAADKDAASILDHANAEAAAMIAKAKVDTDALIARRQRMAEDKIAAAERNAIAELRARAATAAASAAAKLIADRHDADADRAIVDKTIAGLGQRLN
jgi:F-type H+-transporting ATPase subunit b